MPGSSAPSVGVGVPPVLLLLLPSRRRAAAPAATPAQAPRGSPVCPVAVLVRRRRRKGPLLMADWDGVTLETAGDTWNIDPSQTVSLN